MADQPPRDDSIEVRAGEVVAYFPRGIDAAFLAPVDARAWGDALIRAANAADMLATPTA